MSISRRTLSVLIIALFATANNAASDFGVFSGPLLEKVDGEPETISCNIAPKLNTSAAGPACAALCRCSGAMYGPVPSV